MEWLLNQVYNLNVIAVVLIIVVTTSLQKYNTNKELKAISVELYQNVEELKAEIRWSNKK